MNLLARPRGRRALFTILYFSEGAPIGFLWWALPTLLRSADVDLVPITTLLSALVLPWALKFLWAPLIDVCRGPRIGFRGWIVASQAVMVLTLLPLAILGLELDLAALATLLVLHAFAAATQDAAIDGLVVRSTTPAERGSLNGWMQAGMLAGRSLFGGGLLLARAALGDSGIVAVLVATLGLSMLIAFAYREDGEPATRADRGVVREFSRRLRAALASRRTWLALVFAAVAGAGFEAVGGLAGPLLIDRGLEPGDVGAFFALPAVACMAGGALAGGALSDRFGRRGCVALFHVILTTTILAVASMPADAPLVASLLALATVYVAIGLFTASSYALFMDLTDPRLGATQFSAFMGATNLCEAWAVSAAGHLAEGWNASAAFAALALVSMVSLAALRGLGRPH